MPFDPWSLLGRLTVLGRPRLRLSARGDRVCEDVTVVWDQTAFPGRFLRVYVENYGLEGQRFLFVRKRYGVAPNAVRDELERASSLIAFQPGAVHARGTLLYLEFVAFTSFGRLRRYQASASRTC
jgi:hypothetical protein